MNADRLSVLRSPAAAPASVSYTGTAGVVTQTVRGSCVRVWCTTDAIVLAGGTATASLGTALQAYETLWLPLPKGLIQGEGEKIIASAVQISAAGTLFAQQFE